MRQEYFVLLSIITTALTFPANYESLTNISTNLSNQKNEVVSNLQKSLGDAETSKVSLMLFLDGNYIYQNHK